MKLKDLIFEDVHENIKKKFLDDCAAFIEINKNQLQNGNYLLRGTSNDHGDIAKRKPRRRKRVRGDEFLTFLYEKFKPFSVPSRQEMIPTQNGELHSAWRSRNVYVVFPIEYEYKLVYTDGVGDFNSYNPFFDGEFMNLDLERLLYNYARSRKKYGISEPIADVFRGVVNTFQRSSNYSEISDEYDVLWETFVQYKDEFEWGEKHYQKIKKGINDFFDHTHVSKETPLEDGLEVNVYAPSGFYYVKEDLVDKMFKSGVV